MNKYRGKSILAVSDIDFEELTEKSPIAIILHDGEVLLYANTSAVQLFSYSCTKEMIGLRIMDLISNSDKAPVSKRINEILEVATYTSPRECRLIKKDGSCVFAEVSGGPCLYKNRKVVQAVLQDITQRKLIEEALRLSEKRLKKLSEATFEGIGISCGEIIIDANEQLASMMRTKRETLIGKSLFEFVAVESIDLVKAKIKSDEDDTYEIVARRMDGSVFPCEIRRRREKLQDKFVLVSALRDLTERKEIDRRILRAIIDAETSERNRFSCELHEGLGPMLTTLKLYFEWLAETSDGQKRKSITKKGIQYFNQAIQTLEEISYNLSPRELNSLGVIVALKNFIGRIIDVSKIEIKFRHNFDQRFDIHTEISLFRIISELINNTIKHANASIIRIDLHYCSFQNKIELKYNDNGKGIDVNKVLVSRTGNGLMNIKQRVDTIKGGFSFKSAPEKGVKVDIELPVVNCRALK